MQQTSLWAYQEIKSEGKLGPLQERVLDFLKDYGAATNSEISERTGIKINVLTPRTKELREKGLVEEWKKDYCPITGRKVIFWKAS